MHLSPGEYYTGTYMIHTYVDTTGTEGVVYSWPKSTKMHRFQCQISKKNSETIPQTPILGMRYSTPLPSTTPL